jgi:uncharacterized protein
MRLSLCLIVLLLAALAPADEVVAQDIPPRPALSEGLVIDRAGLLSRAERDALNQKLIAFDDTTSSQIVVVIVPSLGGADAQQFATEIGQQWGVGQGGKDNGVVFLVSTEDREVFIATGYGLEGAIPDAVAGRIIRRVVVPNFRRGQFYGGIAEATSALMAAAEGEYEAEPDGGGEGDGVPLALIVIIAVIVIALMSGGRDKGRGGGRRVRRGHGLPPVIVFPGGWGGGHRGGGGGFGGFGGGGGFGGFGGGGFGGGGAGGSW